MLNIEKKILVITAFQKQDGFLSQSLEDSLEQ